MPARRRKAQRIIETDGDIASGVRALRRACPLIRRAHDLAGDPPLRRNEAGFRGLARIVVGQQLSIASASAIWGRVALLAEPFDAPRLMARADEDLRGAGLSSGKIRTLRALATAAAEGALDIAALEVASDEEVHAALCAVHGIGPWTADIYLMFCLGRADAFAAGDLALQIAAGMVDGRSERLSAKELGALAERWQPWRGVAARVLWAYYKVAKETNSGAPV